MSDQTALAIVTPADAKQRALKLIAENKECVSYVRPEDLDTAALFLPVVSVIKPDVGDFHDPIPGIGILPKVHTMNLIREKAGVNITRTETAKRGEYVWVAHAYGDKRQPDGTLQETDASYEFDAEKRAELDFINDKRGNYTSDVAKRKHVLELCKFGEQKAVTGAQLALIHKLAKIPASFKSADELKRGMIVLRVDRNVDGLLKDPAMRDAAIRHALGSRDQVYGPAERNVSPRPAAIAAPAAAPDPEDFDELPEEAPFAEPDPRKLLRDQLATIVADPDKRDALSKRVDRTTGKSALDLVAAAIDDENATAEQLSALAARCAKALGGQA